MRIPLLVLTAAIPALAHADCPVDKSVSVIVSCSAELSGGGPNVTYSDSTKPSALDLAGPSKVVRLAWGDYRLLGELQCSGKSDSTMNWGLHVELTKKGTIAPLAYMRVGAADAATRKGKSALEVTSFAFLTPGVPNPNQPTSKLSRVDYTCHLHVD